MLGVLAIALPLALDTLPSVSLGEAIARAARFDPAYVSALGQADNAAWARRAARLAFIVPSIEVGVDATKYSSPFFNPGTGQQGTSAVTTHVAASYEVLSVRKIADLAATDAGHEAAAAGELAQRFQTAMATEADYYDVWSGIFRNTFFEVQAEWCARNNVEYLVHLNHEEQGLRLDLPEDLS